MGQGKGRYWFLARLALAALATGRLLEGKVIGVDPIAWVRCCVWVEAQLVPKPIVAASENHHHLVIDYLVVECRLAIVISRLTSWVCFWHSTIAVSWTDGCMY